MHHGLGWLPELPDVRDLILDEQPEMNWLNVRASPFGAVGAPSVIPGQFDFSQYCSPTENQGRLGSCTGQAAVGAVEYMERRATRRHVNGSRLFVYKMARKLDGFTGDTGAYIRSAMKSLRIFGVPPEKYWPHDISKFDEEPTPYVYALGHPFRTLRYYRLDNGRDPESLLYLIKRVVAASLPVVFGFAVFSYGNDDGEFPMPEKGDRLLGGHAIVAVGYDDGRVIGKSTGAFKIRNSWGTSWGQEGYGWLPYDYVLKRLSRDFWTIFQQSYLLD